MKTPIHDLIDKKLRECILKKGGRFVVIVREINGEVEFLIEGGCQEKVKPARRIIDNWLGLTI